MKTKQIPALTTLGAGLITCIISFINRVSMTYFVKSLCLAVVVFFILGCVVKFIIDKNFAEKETEEATGEATEEASLEQEDAEIENEQKQEQ